MYVLLEKDNLHDYIRFTWRKLPKTWEVHHPKGPLSCPNSTAKSPAWKVGILIVGLNHPSFENFFVHFCGVIFSKHILKPLPEIWLLGRWKRYCLLSPSYILDIVGGWHSANTATICKKTIYPWSYFNLPGCQFITSKNEDILITIVYLYTHICIHVNILYTHL